MSRAVSHWVPDQPTDLSIRRSPPPSCAALLPIAPVKSRQLTAHQAARPRFFASTGRRSSRSGFHYASRPRRGCVPRNAHSPWQIRTSQWATLPKRAWVAGADAEWSRRTRPETKHHQRPRDRGNPGRRPWCGKRGPSREGGKQYAANDSLPIRRPDPHRDRYLARSQRAVGLGSLFFGLTLAGPDQIGVLTLPTSADPPFQDLATLIFSRAPRKTLWGSDSTRKRL